jgi:hypothetical protein
LFLKKEKKKFPTCNRFRLSFRVVKEGNEGNEGKCEAKRGETPHRGERRE